MSPSLLPNESALLSDIRTLIEQGRQQLASTVNSALTLLYWQIGQRIRLEVADRRERIAQRVEPALVGRAEG